MKTEKGKEDIKESEFFNYKTIYIIFFVYSIIYYFSGRLHLSVLVFLFCISTFFFFQNRKIKVFLRFLGLFLLLHLIVFPFIYLFILNVDSNSFKFEETIKNSEKKTSIIELEEVFKPNQIKNKLIIIDAILNSNSKKLDTTLNYLNLKNIIQIDSFKIFVSSTHRDPFASGNSVPEDTNFVDFTICNNEGVFIEKISEISHSIFYKEERKIKEFLIQHKEKLNYELNNFRETELKIVEKDSFWTYSNILAYTINIFGSGNMIPISRIANVFFAIHSFIVYGFILTFVISSLYEFLIKKYL